MRAPHNKYQHSKEERLAIVDYISLGGACDQMDHTALMEANGGSIIGLSLLAQLLL